MKAVSLAPRFLKTGSAMVIAFSLAPDASAR